jgi:hypothetical protein
MKISKSIPSCKNLDLVSLCSISSHLIVFCLPILPIPAYHIGLCSKSHTNAITAKEIGPLFLRGKVWMGVWMKPEANVIKPLTAVSYDFLQQARVFTSGKPLQPNLKYMKYKPRWKVQH